MSACVVENTVGTILGDLTVGDFAALIIAKAKYPGRFLRMISRESQKKVINLDSIEKIIDGLQKNYNSCRKMLQPRRCKFLLEFIKQAYTLV